jgi:hypothetical protein
MKKSEAKFNKNAKKQIDHLARENQNNHPWNNPQPIFIPKRKKFKK